jgi:16S rRNA (guanine527-N7)-methyltransferase
MTETTGEKSAAHPINEGLSAAGLPQLDPAQSAKFAGYLSLIMRWNARTNLTAVREESAIIDRHFVECIACAQALPQEITTLLDFGSGAGFPGIPIAICRPEITVTLAESQGKKAAFLREAVMALGLEANVHTGRAEEINVEFDCVTLRAVDRMEAAIGAASKLVRRGGWLAPMTTDQELPNVKVAAGDRFEWREPLRLPGGESRIFALGVRLSDLG